jgi:myo-inositol-1(or 4)-monophosphatase
MSKIVVKKTAPSPQKTLSSQDLVQRYHAIAGLVRDAGVLAMRYFGKTESLGISMKGAQDWLTAADGAVETYLREKLATAFPEDSVIGEEGAKDDMDKASARQVWIIDPIDGTANFARGDRNWCISIGFVVDGIPTIGAIFAPALDETYLAMRGKGSTLNGEPIHVAKTARMARAAIEMGWSSRLPLEGYLAMVEAGFRAGSAVKRSASGAMGLVHVACGRTDAYAELHINSWDVAAGLVIATEAGAVVNDFFAGDGLRKGNPILCCTPKLARALVDITGIQLKPTK